MEPFKLFGLQHVTTLLLVVVGSFVAFQAGRGPRSSRWNLAGGLFFALYAVALWSYKLKDGIQWELDLPLQLCDLIFLLCLACFISPRPLLVTLATYWGLAGTLQALITPDVRQAFPSWEFVFFFVGHSAIILAIFFLLGRAPHEGLQGRSGIKTSFLWLLGYVALAGGFNKLLNVNYGYLSAKPQRASILDLFGPWPVYIGAGVGLALVLFVGISGILSLLPLETRGVSSREE